jgi:hypothetical protein
MLTNESNSKCTTKITKVEGEIMHNRLTWGIPQKVKEFYFSLPMGRFTSIGKLSL